VHQTVIKVLVRLSLRLQRPNDGRYFHEVRACAGDDVDEFQPLAPAISMVTRLTSMISSKRIGAGPPEWTASTNAFTQTFCPLCCRHKIHLAEARPAEPGKFSKVIELQDASRSEGLQPFFGKRLAAVGEVVDRADRSIGKK